MSKISLTNPSLGHQAKYLEDIKRILLDFDEVKNYALFIFGSRADGTAHLRSDIDIGILGKAPLPALLKLNIEDKLAESDVPLKIEFVDFFQVDRHFKDEAIKNIIVWNLPKDISLA